MIRPNIANNVLAGPRREEGLLMKFKTVRGQIIRSPSAVAEVGNLPDPVETHRQARLSKSH